MSSPSFEDHLLAGDLYLDCVADPSDPITAVQSPSDNDSQVGFVSSSKSTSERRDSASIQPFVSLSTEGVSSPKHLQNDEVIKWDTTNVNDSETQSAADLSVKLTSLSQAQTEDVDPGCDRLLSQTGSINIDLKEGTPSLLNDSCDVYPPSDSSTNLLKQYPPFSSKSQNKLRVVKFSGRSEFDEDLSISESTALGSSNSISHSAEDTKSSNEIRLEDLVAAPSFESCYGYNEIFGKDSISVSPLDHESEETESNQKNDDDDESNTETEQWGIEKDIQVAVEAAIKFKAALDSPPSLRKESSGPGPGITAAAYYGALGLDPYNPYASQTQNNIQNPCQNQIPSTKTQLPPGYRLYPQPRNQARYTSPPKRAVPVICRHWLAGRCNVMYCRFRHDSSGQQPLNENVQIQEKSQALVQTSDAAKTQNNLGATVNALSSQAINCPVVPPNQRPRYQNLIASPMETRVCRHWLQNRCNVVDCRFLHSYDGDMSGATFDADAIIDPNMLNYSQGVVRQGETLAGFPMLDSRYTGWNVTGM